MALFLWSEATNTLTTLNTIGWLYLGIPFMWTQQWVLFLVKHERKKMQAVPLVSIFSLQTKDEPWTLMATCTTNPITVTPPKSSVLDATKSGATGN